MEVKNVKKRFISLSVCFVVISASLLGLAGTVSADAPETPGVPDGPTEADVNELVAFSVIGVNTTDDHDVLYEFDWGDDTTTGWLGPFPAGPEQTIEAQHLWQEVSAYEVTVRAKDNTTGNTSAWSDPFTIAITPPGPDFSVSSITGGFGVTAGVTNNLAPSKYVNYSIEVAGGQITGFHVHQQFEGEVFVTSGSTEYVSTPSFFALGRVKITVTAQAAGEEVVERVATGFTLFYYTLMMAA